MRHFTTVTKQTPSTAQLEAAIQLVALLQSILGLITDFRKFKSSL